MATKKKLVIVGNGMVGHKLLERLIATSAMVTWEVTVLGEEPRVAYDRVNLSKLFDGSTPEDLALGSRRNKLRVGPRPVVACRAREPQKKPGTTIL